MEETALHKLLRGGGVTARLRVDGRYELDTGESVAEKIAGYGAVKPYAVVFMYPPVGWQHVNMGRALYEHDETFRAAILQCSEITKALLPTSIEEVLYPSAMATPVYEEMIHEPLYAQPCLFAVEWALTMMWRREGVRATAVIGHSLGEYVAAAAAGVMSMELALTLVVERARLINSARVGGCMVAVKVSAAAAEAAVAGEQAAASVAIAAINSDESTVLSGEPRALSQVLSALPPSASPKRVKASHADHSPLMQPLLERFRAVASALFEASAPRLPSIPIASTVTGEIAGDEICSAEHWVRHNVAPVQFTAAFRTLLELLENAAANPRSEFERQPEALLVEMGGGMLNRFARGISGAISLAEIARGSCALTKLDCLQMIPRVGSGVEFQTSDVAEQIKSEVRRHVALVKAEALQRRLLLPIECKDPEFLEMFREVVMDR